MAAHVHGVTGLDGADLPEPEPAADGNDASPSSSRRAGADRALWLVGVGPLTNLALALRRRPTCPTSSPDLLMGGGTFGNRTAVAEFNIWADPEAAAVVFGYGGPLVMAGLDLTYELQATPERLEQLAAVPGRLAETLTGLLRFFSTGYIASHEDFAGCRRSTTRAQCWRSTHPQLFRRTARHVAVETRGQLTRWHDGHRPPKPRRATTTHLRGAGARRDGCRLRRDPRCRRLVQPVTAWQHPPIGDADVRIRNCTYPDVALVDQFWQLREPRWSSGRRSSPRGCRLRWQR